MKRTQYQLSGLALSVGVGLLFFATSAAHAADIRCPTPEDLNQQYFCTGVQATCVGTDDADEIIGTDGDDVIVGLQGFDDIYAGKGNDIVCGNRGRDVIDGGPGTDKILGGDGDDLLAGGGGVDALDGGDGEDTCSTEAIPSDNCEFAAAVIECPTSNEEKYSCAGVLATCVGTDDADISSGLSLGE